MAIGPVRYLFSVDEYEQMGRTGVLDPELRLELLDGEIIEMAPIGPEHSSCVMRLTWLFISRLGTRMVLSPQNPVRLFPRSEPQPDIVLLRGGMDQYHHRLPTATDVLLVVEVAKSSLALDRTVKLPIYARQGIPEVWIVDLDGEAVEVYRQPGPDGYAELARVERGGTVSPAAFPDLTLTADEILGY
ncbi:MAG: Uma2 family endonuclease [Acidimicrobiales bacterium]